MVHPLYDLSRDTDIRKDYLNFQDDFLMDGWMLFSIQERLEL